MRTKSWSAAALALALGAAACADESPTTVGADLLDEGLRTVAVVLDAPEFLQGDTTYDGIGSLDEVRFGILANDFAGELDANVLFQILRPTTVVYTDTANTTQVDTIIGFKGGVVTVLLDTLSELQGPLTFEVLDVAEEWDPTTASWDLRVDSGGVSEAWTTPGGTTGGVLGTATWQSREESGDSVQIVLDSAAVAPWTDSETAKRGGLLRVADAGRRLRLQFVRFHYDVVPVDFPDTIVPAGEITQELTVASPDVPPAPNTLRVGGVPGWRSLLHFLPLADLPVPCEEGSTTCTVPLSRTTVNAANLLIDTEAVGGRRVERPMRLEARAVLEGPAGVPLTRSPLSLAFGRMDEGLADTAFVGSPVTAKVPLTGYVQRNIDPPGDESPLLWVALTPEGEKTIFGYGQFAGLSSASPPRLQLVVSIPLREVNP